MRKLSTFFANLAFLAFAVGCLSHTRRPEGVFWFVLYLAISAALKAIADYKETRETTEEARAIVEEVLAGGSPYFYLYLRPFVLTNKLPNPNPIVPPIQERLKTPRSQDAELLLYRSLKKWGTPLIGLGSPGETIGAGRYKTEEQNWEAVFEKLARTANGIVIIPSTRSGTLKEAKFLRANGLIEKTLFLHLGPQLSESWPEITRAYSEFGLILPTSITSTEGAIIKISDEGEVLGRAPLVTLWNASGGNTVQKLKRLKESSTPLLPMH